MSLPSQLIVYASSLNRLLKEEASYHEELKIQEQRLQRLESQHSHDENKEWMLKQERASIEETKAIFPILRQKIWDSMQKLESIIEAEQSRDHIKDDMHKARAVLQHAKNTHQGVWEP